MGTYANTQPATGRSPGPSTGGGAAKAGTTVSLVVPARNEAATVGDVVTRVREALVDTVALLDEVVVIDSDSTDGTFEVAADAGARVHRSAEIRPDLGTLAGKGEAMWKSLFVTTGDLVVFPEAIVPGYPDWVWRTPAWSDSEWYQRLYDQAVDIPDWTMAEELMPTISSGRDVTEAIRISPTQPLPMPDSWAIMSP